MDSGAGAIWRWSAAKTVETPSTWEPVPQAEATLLEHAYLQAWNRIELAIDGTPYVIDPFLSNGAANIATPLDDPRGPVLLFARIPSVATEHALDRSGGKSGLSSAETPAEASCQVCSSVLASQHQKISSFSELTSALPRAAPSADSTAAVSRVAQAVAAAARVPSTSYTEKNTQV
ncbi:hypothetical protein Emag_000494 [Eimeria magna]